MVVHSTVDSLDQFSVVGPQVHSYFPVIFILSLRIL